MTNTKLILGAMMIAGLIAPAALAATGTANAGAEIVTPIAISSTTAMDFGHVANGATGGTVILSNSGARAAFGGVTLASSAGVTPSQAVFAVTGDANASYAITLPTSTTLTSGADSMTLDTFTSNPNATSTIGAGGVSALNVGATLHVTANQPVGTYAGTFDVAVDYN